MYTVYVCGGSESEYTSDRKNFILGPRLEEGNNRFSVLFKGGGRKFFKQLMENICFFNICFHFQDLESFRGFALWAPIRALPCNSWGAQSPQAPSCREQ